MGGGSILWLCLVAILGLAACADAPALPSPQPYTPAQLASLRWRAVLVGGDSRLRVFDNAIAHVAAWLRDSGGVRAQSITRLSATPSANAAPASWDNVMRTIEAMHPAAGQACFVFITSHGLRDQGVELSFSANVLRPDELDRALAIGCGNAPTVAIVSACFSGSFAAPPMTRANRIVLTAARADRTSFGCGADQTYTFFDRCLLTNLPRAPDWFELNWRALYDKTRACVEQRERRGDYVPSEPQAWFGAAVAGLSLPHPH